MTTFGGFAFDESPFAGMDLLSNRCAGQTRQQPPNTGRPGTPQPNNPGTNRGNTGSPRQTPGTQRPAGQGSAGPGASGATAKNPQAPAAKKVSEEDKRKERARALFADAANAQNNGAYALAMEQWSKLIKEFPTDPLASSARYYLGLCYQEQETPDYNNAVGTFRKALEDKNLKEQEEAMLNLGWCLVQLGTLEDSQSDEAKRKASLAEGAKVLAAYLEKYPDSNSVDRAMFYAAEAESRLGNSEKAIGLYNQLVQNKKLAQSPWIPEALFAIGFSYEEIKQPKLAGENYDALIANHPKHPLVRDANLRLGEISLQSDKPALAVERYKKVVESPEFLKAPLADYILSRYAFALAKSGDYAKSAEVYKQLATQFPKSKYAQNASLATAQTLLRDKKYEQAAEAFKQVVEGKDEKAIEAAHWLCQIAVLQNRPADAVPIARDALGWIAKLNNQALSTEAKNQIGLLRMDLADGLFATAEGKLEARRLYEQVALEYADQPISPRATYNAAFAALQTGDLPEAQRWSEAFTKQFPTNDLGLDVAYVRAEALLQQGQHAPASEAFEKLVSAGKEHPSRDAWELRGITAQYLAGEPEKAIARIDALMASPALKDNPQSPMLAEALFLKGASLLRLTKSEDSIPVLEKSLQASTSWGQADEVLLVLAQAYEAKQDKEKAKATLEKLLKDFPKSRFKGQAEFRLGQLSAQLGNAKEAIGWYERLLGSDADVGLKEFAKFDSAYLMIQEGQTAKAKALFDDLISTSKNAGLVQEATVASAICLREANEYEKAGSLLSKLLTESLSKPTLSKVLYELGVVQAQSGKYQDAIVSFDRLEQESPQYALMDRVLFERAWAFKESGDVEKANRDFQQLAQKFPESPLAAESYFHVGQAEFENASFDTAVKAYSVAAKKSSNKELQEKSTYKIGLALFQLGQFDDAGKQFSKQISEFPKGSLTLDAKLMVAECAFKQRQFPTAMMHYEVARKAIEGAQKQSEADGQDPRINEQVQALVYLHGAQTASELKKWADVESWVEQMQKTVPNSTLLPVAKYEQAVALQNLRKNAEALKTFEAIAEEQRNELGARSRFMAGELNFAQKEFGLAVNEFQKVMYGFGGTQAPAEIKNWQARSAYEAGRCSEVLIGELTGERRKKGIEAAKKFYEFLLENHAEHELTQQAKERIGELSRE